jgi:hypothetical protein
VVKQRADNVLHHVKHPHEYAEDDRAIMFVTISGLLRNPRPMRKASPIMMASN